MKASLEPYIYGDPPVTKVRKKYPACGHWRGRVIIAKDLKTGWCWGCQKRVKMTRIGRPWKRLTKRFG